MVKKHRHGFTLIELLVVMTIIGLLSTIATVNYSSSRMKARNATRLADMDSIRTALELYYATNDGYPGDNTPAPGGLVLGRAGAKELTSDGFSDKVNGEIYLESVPSNPQGGGADYLYYSLNNDGTHCNLAVCPDFSVEFILEAPVNDLPAGAYVAGPIQNKLAPLLEAAKILARAQTAPVDGFTGSIMPLVDSAAGAVNAVRNDPTVDAVSTKVVAPIATASAIVSTASGLSSLGALIFMLITQPFLFLRKRRDYSWGIVYDSQKKMPVDLAIVRLIDADTRRVVQTRVTDKAGRIFFFAGKGTYRLEAVKQGYVFPATTMAGEHEDGKFANLYFGQKFSVPDAGQVINPSIPLDPTGTDLSDRDFIKRFVRNNIRYAVSLIGTVLTLIAFAITPTALVGGLLAFNIALYFIFLRLSRPKQPAEWGTVKDEKTGRPVNHAVVRLFSSPYDKLIETRVTDGRGRYNFVVGQNVFYLTATSKGYWKTESFPLDLRGSNRPEVISAPVRLRRLSSAAEAPDRLDADVEKR